MYGVYHVQDPLENFKLKVKIREVIVDCIFSTYMSLIHQRFRRQRMEMKEIRVNPTKKRLLYPGKKRSLGHGFLSIISMLDLDP
jgi:hypothetical protein